MPTTQVVYAHDIPHLNSQLQPQDNGFSLSASYYNGLLNFPLLILAICTVLTIGLGLSLCCYGLCTCLWSKHRKALDPNDPNYMELLAKQVNYHVNIVRSFLFFSICLFIVNFFVWYGSSDITNAFLSIISGLKQINSFFTSIVNLTVALILNASNFITAISVDCVGSSNTSELVAEVNTITSVTNSIESLAQSITSAIQNIANQIPGYISKKDVVIGCFFAVIIFMLSIFMVALYFSSRSLFRFAIIASWMAVLILFVISSLEMVIVVSISLH